MVEVWKRHARRSSEPVVVLPLFLWLIVKGTVTSAYGSSFVRMGSTSVVCGVRGEIAAADSVGRLPIPSCPSVIVTLELLPFATSSVVRGRPGELAQSLTHLLNSVLADVVDPASLVAVTSPPLTAHRWYLSADVYVLEHAGNLFDVAVLAVLAALQDTRLPEVLCSDDILLEGERRFPLTLLSMPLSLTCAHIDGNILVDPTREEEELADGLVTVVAFDDETSREARVQLCEVRGRPLPPTALEHVLALATRRHATHSALLK